MSEHDDAIEAFLQTKPPAGEAPPSLYPQDEVSKELMEAALEPPEEMKALTRNPDGTFPAGVSGNPKGRTKGVKNRVTLARLMVEEALRRKLGRASDRLLDTAINQALNGNDKIMRVLLDKLLASPKNDDSENAKDSSVTVVIENHTEPQATKIVAQQKKRRDEDIVVIPSEPIGT